MTRDEHLECFTHRDKEYIFFIVRFPAEYILVFVCAKYLCIRDALMDLLLTGDSNGFDLESNLVLMNEYNLQWNDGNNLFGAAFWMETSHVKCDVYDAEKSSEWNWIECLLQSFGEHLWFVPNKLNFSSLRSRLRTKHTHIQKTQIGFWTLVTCIKTGRIWYIVEHRQIIATKKEKKWTKTKCAMRIEHQSLNCT